MTKQHKDVYLSRCVHLVAHPCWERRVKTLGVTFHELGLASLDEYVVGIIVFYLHSTHIHNLHLTFLTIKNKIAFAIYSSFMVGWDIYETWDPVKKCTCVVGRALEGNCDLNIQKVSSYFASVW